MSTVVSEFEGVDLGDRRLAARLKRIAAALEPDPSRSFPEAMGSVAGREAFYRFVNNDRVDLPALLEGHVAQTVERAAAVGGMLVVAVDKTTFTFEGDSEREGLSRLQKSDQGFEAFFALATTPDRAPLGVLEVQPLEDRGRSEASAWCHAIEAADAHVGSLRPVFVVDREADAYELMARLSKDARQFVVRVSRDRYVREHTDAAQETLHELATRAPVVMTREVKLSRRTAKNRPPGSRTRNPPREGRDARLSVRARQVVVPKPRKLRSVDAPTSLKLHVVLITEENPPNDEHPVEWVLFTTLPIDTLAELAAIVDAYRARWTIEEYFKALKSGCAYERRQLESKDALVNALGILAPIAWRLLALKHAARHAEQPATTVLDADEIHVLRQLSTDVRIGKSPTASEALRAVASIGGHIRQNGPPGWIVIWRGFRRLLDQVDGYRLARAEM